MPAKNSSAAAIQDDGPALYIVGEQYRWATYREAGQEDDPIQPRVKLRKHLINDEFESLIFEPFPKELTGEALEAATDAREVEVRDAMARFVVDWNVRIRDDDGDIVKPDPPSIGGGEQFGKYLPTRIIVEIYRDLLASTGLVTSKPLSSSAPMVGRAGSTSDNSETSATNGAGPT